MSDLNDDLLNYDIGEDIDEQVLLAADEDDLLLSDEAEIDEQKAILKDEAEQWVNSKLKGGKPQKPTGADDKKVEEVVTTSTSCTHEISKDRDKVVTAAESDVSTSEESPAKKHPIDEEPVGASSCVQPSKNDEVSSTNKEIEDQTVSQTSEAKSENIVDLPNTKDEDKSAAVLPGTSENDQSSDPREDPDEERGERTNIKLSAERDDQGENSSEKVQPGRFPSKRGRGGLTIRGGHFPGSRPPVRYPHLNYPPYPHHHNENVNPQMAASAGQYPTPYGPMDQQMGGVRQPAPYGACNPMPPRMDYRPLVPNFRPQTPNEFSMYRGMRPDYINGVQYGNFGPHGMRPMYRPDNAVQLPPHMRQRLPLQRPPTGPPPGQGNFIPQQHPPMGPGGGQHGGALNPAGGVGAGHSLSAPMTGHPGSGVGSAVLPRKVLINPNFKGGVEAATSQLMKDTQFIQAISSHVSHLQSDEELLRQQEEFINKNRIHIEKRRYERSPERNRSRERSYSPPRRGDRDRRADSRERRAGSRGRTRRCGSREFESRNPPKRRRSDSFERRREKDKDRIEEEDEETRAYRLEIEKQKAMREKILKDKEMRRRKAAEGKLNEEKVTEEPPAKLKPIIVTESKIISLKKKPKTNDENEKQQPQQQQVIASQKPKPIQRTIPTAKILPEAIKKITDHTSKESIVHPTTTASSSGSATLAVIKPVVKKTTKKPQLDVKSAILDEDELLEEELLADTPSPPASPKSLSPIDPFSDAPTRGGSAFISSNRRVILKSSKDSNRPSSDCNTSTTEQTKKGIFDRLEKRKIMVKNAE
ncbi:uncharacterized protein LOC119653679 isoform X4 [Hermetia illucens]|uniref:uncharacterized protein LOC119653679 isoform X4 n=1 Tax=Hermetia illucens TaxID=343691 RepID=UPI0018CC4095|nr:uncharacterized protein LOC119653679 isoform X4 [Hermetia illucens]